MPSHNTPRIFLCLAVGWVLSIPSLAAASNQSDTLNFQAEARSKKADEYVGWLGGAKAWVERYHPTLEQLGQRIIALPPDAQYYKEWRDQYEKKRVDFEATLKDQKDAVVVINDWYVDSRTWERDHEKDANLDDKLRRKLHGSLNNLDSAIKGYGDAVSRRSTAPIEMPTEGSPPALPSGEEVFPPPDYLQAPPERVTVGAPYLVVARFRNNSLNRIYVTVRLVGEGVSIQGGERSFWIEPKSQSGKYSWTVRVDDAGSYSVTMERKINYYQGPGARE